MRYVLALFLSLITSQAFAAASLVPAFSTFSSAGMKVNAGKQGTNTMQVIGATFSKPGGKPTMTILAPFVRAESYASLAAAVAAIGSTPTTLSFGTDQTLSANLTTPSTLELLPLNGAIIDHGAYTISYAGSTARWPLAQVLNGTGAVTGLKESRPEWFAGATGLAKAIVASNLILLSDATYAPAANLTLTGKTLKGVPRKSIIRPTSAVTVSMTVNASTSIDGVVLDGTNTTGAKGFYVAGNVVDDDISIINSHSINFTGANAVGVHINAAVNANLEFMFINGNQRGLLVDGGSNSLPTTVTVRKCQISNNVTEGALVKTGQMISFPDTIFQSNGAEGLRVVPAGFTAFDINVDYAWFENNQLANGARTSSYSMYVDGTNSGAVPVRVSAKNTHFGVGITTERSLYIQSAYYTLQDLEISIGDREQVTIGALASGSWYGVPSAVNPDLMINDLSKLMSHDSKWVAWVPTIASDIGNSAATFVSAPTVTARYKLLGKTLHISVKVAGTLKAVTPTYISFSMPTSLTVVGSNIAAAQLISGGVYSGANLSAVTTTIYLQKFDASALTSGAAITFQGSSTFEVSY